MPADTAALLREAAAGLPGDTPRLDAELLLAHVLGVDRTRLLLNPPALTVAHQAAFAGLLRRRQAHEPVAHLIGEREFWSLPLKVTPATLVPRPDSETLIVAALAAFAARPPARILDLGTGSGALLLAALSEWPDAEGLGVDQSDGALAVAAANARALGLADRAQFRRSDWLSAVDGRFDLILCNPPYIPEGTMLMPDVALHEPATALFGGADGLDPYRILLPQISAVLADGGVALFEFGAGQEAMLEALAREAGWRPEFHADLAGRPRAMQLRQADRAGLGKGHGNS